MYCNNLANFYQILRLVMSKSQKCCTIWCGMTHLNKLDTSIKTRQNKLQNLTIYFEKVRGTTAYLERLKENSNRLITLRNQNY